MRNESLTYGHVLASAEEDEETRAECPECAGTGWKKTAALYPPARVADQNPRKYGQWTLDVGCTLCGPGGSSRGRGTITSSGLAEWRRERNATGLALLRAPRGE
jgi:hypothetical protein